MSDLPRGTVTFLFTDIESSTALWERDPTAMRPAVDRHFTLLREAITAHHGVLFKTVGDAVHAAFGSAAGAVAAAVAAQQALLAEPWALAEPLRVRMALHTGDVTPIDGDYAAPVLNRLARLLAVGHGGQILLAATTQHLVRGALPPGTELHDHGEHRLRDLQPEHIFHLIGAGLPTNFPPLRTLEHHPNNLPVQLTPFIGRDRELTAVGEVVRRSEVRLLTLTGPGGTGKTRLALQVAAESSEHFPGGVYFVNLAPVTDPAMVLAAVAAALGVQESGGRALNEAVTTFLTDKRLLLVLDNFEQLVEAAALVADLLTTCPQLTVLVTSRVRLGLYGEREYPVPPLGLPDPRQLPDLATLSQYEAVRLFIARAQAVKPDFAVTNESAPAVAEICTRLDGLPLAIELAAARVRLLSPAALLTRLEHRLPILTGGGRNVPERQRTLRATIAWSYGLLTLEEQALFRHLSVFAGGWSLEAAEAVGVSPTDVDRDLSVLDALERLVDHHLIQPMRGSDDQPRFTMLATIQEYGVEQLQANGEADDVRRRHARFFLALAEEAAPELNGPQRRVWRARLDRDHDNVRAALGWLIESGDSEASLRLAGAMSRFWMWRTSLSEARDWLERALILADDASPASRAKALSEASLVMSAQGDDAQGRKLASEALDLYEAIGDPVGIVQALRLSARFLHQTDPVRAMAILEEALERARTVGDGWLISGVLKDMAIKAYWDGNLALAGPLSEQAAQAARKLGNMIRLEASLLNLGNVRRDEGDLSGAEAAYREGLAIAWEEQDRPQVGWFLLDLAMTAALRLQPRRAARLFGAAEVLYEELSHEGDMSIFAVDLYRRRVTTVHEALGDTAFHATWAAGRSLSLDEVVAEALTPADAGDAPG